LARVTGFRDAHHHALIMRRIPAADLWQGDREGCPGKTQCDTENLNSADAAQSGLPDIGNRTKDDQLSPDRGAPCTDFIGEGAQGDTEQCPGQNWRGDQRELCFNRQSQITGDIDDQRTQRYPDHEAEIEIKEASQKCRPVTGLFKITKIH
jgi:hypothetical protein